MTALNKTVESGWGGVGEYYNKCPLKTGEEGGYVYEALTRRSTLGYSNIHKTTENLRRDRTGTTSGNTQTLRKKPR